MNAIIIGTDRGLGTALEALEIDVTRLTGPVTGDALADAGIDQADLLVVTDVGEATLIPIAKDVNPRVRVVIYSPESMPEFVRGQVDFAVAPDVLNPSIVAEELVGAEA